jgi:hypothetical protein
VSPPTSKSRPGGVVPARIDQRRATQATTPIAADRTAAPVRVARECPNCGRSSEPFVGALDASGEAVLAWCRWCGYECAPGLWRRDRVADFAGVLDRLRNEVLAGPGRRRAARAEALVRTLTALDERACWRNVSPGHPALPGQRVERVVKITGAQLGPVLGIGPSGVSRRITELVRCGFLRPLVRGVSLPGMAPWPSRYELPPSVRQVTNWQRFRRLYPRAWNPARRPARESDPDPTRVIDRWECARSPPVVARIFAECLHSVRERRPRPRAMVFRVCAKDSPEPVRALAGSGSGDRRMPS